MTSELVPVGQLEVGDLVKVGERTGFREVLDVVHYPPHRLAHRDGRSVITVPAAVVVIYKPTALGTAFENRAKAKREASYYHRTEASFARKPGELVERRRSA